MQSMTRRTLLGSALLAGLAACARPSDGSSPATTGSDGGSAAAALTLGLTYVPDIQFAPAYVADKLGWFTEEGVSVTLRHHGANESLLGALQTGDEQVVFAGGGEMLQGRSEGVTVRNFATAYQIYPASIIVPADSPIQSFADLRGHSVGLPGEYGENWFYLLAVLTQSGLSRDDIDVASIGYTQFAALSGGKVDAVVGFLNNEVVRFNEAGFAVRTISLEDPPLVSAGLGATDATIAERPADLVGLLTALTRGAELCTSDPEQAVQLSVDYVPTLAEPDQQAHALAVLKATTELYGGQFGVQNPGRWEAMASFFADSGLVSSPVPAGDAYTTQIVAR